MPLATMFAEAAFLHGRTCRFDRHGNPVVHEVPTPWGEEAFGKLLEFVNSIEWDSRDKRRR